MSYSEHFRRKILAKLEEGYSIRAVAAQFEINKNTIVEWKKRIEIKKTRVRKPSKINDDALREVIYAELSGDFPLGDSRQPTYKSLRPFDLVS